MRNVCRVRARHVAETLIFSASVALVMFLMVRQGLIVERFKNEIRASVGVQRGERVGVANE